MTILICKRINTTTLPNWHNNVTFNSVKRKISSHKSLEALKILLDKWKKTKITKATIIRVYTYSSRHI